jgi:hypothetical protein
LRIAWVELAVAAVINGVRGQVVPGFFDRTRSLQNVALALGL